VRTHLNSRSEILFTLAFLVGQIVQIGVAYARGSVRAHASKTVAWAPTISFTTPRGSGWPVGVPHAHGSIGARASQAAARASIVSHQSSWVTLVGSAPRTRAAASARARAGARPGPASPRSPLLVDEVVEVGVAHARGDARARAALVGRGHKAGAR
jgi:hypothetical protein